MRRTVSKLAFYPHNGGHRSYAWVYGYSGSYMADHKDDIIVANPKPILALLQYVECERNYNNVLTMWLRDVKTKFEYPVTIPDFAKMVPHLQNSYIFGLFNPVSNSAGRHSLEYMDVQINLAEEEKNA